MLHYNLACSYAEFDDLDSALGDLKFAFAYRQNGLPGEELPDPAKDPSFRRFLADARFASPAHQVCPESQKTGIGFGPYVRYYAVECLSLVARRQTTLFLATGLKTVAHPRFSNDVIGSAVGFYLPA